MDHTTAESPLTARWRDAFGKQGGGPTRVFFYCSPLMRCAEEQLHALYTVCKSLFVCPVHWSYRMPDDANALKRDTSTLYVIGTSMRELELTLRRLRGAWPPHYIWFQTEQYTNQAYFRRSIAFASMLRGALWVWEYAEANAHYLRTVFFNRPTASQRHLSAVRFGAPPITVVPHGITPVLTSATRADDDGTFDDDVLLLGGVSGADRQRFVAVMRDKFALQVRGPPRGTYWYGEEREQRIRRARVCVNIHYYRCPSVQETARLTLYLSHGACVVSEQSTCDEGRMDERFGDAVVWVPQCDAQAPGAFDEMGRALRRLLSDPDEWRAQRERARAWAGRPEHRPGPPIRSVLEPLLAPLVISAPRD